MKLTKKRLRQIIKEELEKLSEGISPEEGERAKEKYPEHYELIYDNFLNSVGTQEKKMMLADLLANNGIGGLKPLGDEDIAHALIYQARADHIKSSQAAIARNPPPKSTVSDEESERSQAAAYERDPERFTRGT
jgi:hypothetical protein